MTLPLWALYWTIKFLFLFLFLLISDLYWGFLTPISQILFYISCIYRMKSVILEFKKKDFCCYILFCHLIIIYQYVSLINIMLIELLYYLFKHVFYILQMQIDHLFKRKGFLMHILYPHSMSGGYIAITLSVRSHFRNKYLSFYWKK